MITVYTSYIQYEREEPHGDPDPKFRFPAHLRADRPPGQRALPPGAALPSIRALARDLKISVITTKRAYDELEAAGFLVTVAGKGSFVAEGNRALQREARLREMEEHLTKAIALGRECGLGTEELRESLALLLKEEAQ